MFKEERAMKAIIVDSSLAVRKAMEIQLGQYGMEVDFAKTGESALEHVEECAYDIIFLGVMLPGINGFEVCKKIKSNKALKKIPVIILTGRDVQVNKIKGIMAGANDYLIKQVQPEKLKKIIKQHLGTFPISHSSDG
jgi:twitching motility two-component system response regulator PilG